MLGKAPRRSWEAAELTLKEKWDAGMMAIVRTAPWQFHEWMKARGLKDKGVEGGDAFLHRMGRSLAKKPLKWGQRCASEQLAYRYRTLRRSVGR